MYYEVHGGGEPVVLLHGAFMTITNNWAGWISELSKTRKVIAVVDISAGRKVAAALVEPIERRSEPLPHDRGATLGNGDGEFDVCHHEERPFSLSSTSRPLRYMACLSTKVLPPQTHTAPSPVPPRYTRRARGLGRGP